MTARSKRKRVFELLSPTNTAHIDCGSIDRDRSSKGCEFDFLNESSSRLDIFSENGRKLSLIAQTISMCLTSEIKHPP